MISPSNNRAGGVESASEGSAMMTHFPLLDEGEEESIRGSGANSVLGNGLLGSLFGGFLRGHTAPTLTLPATSEPMAAEEPQSASAGPTDLRREEGEGVAADEATGSVEDQTPHRGGRESRRLSKASLQTISAALKQGLANGARSEALVDYHKSEFKRYWMPDSTGKECYDCRERFTVFNRRHHCRLCGQIFCARCSNQHVDGTKLGYSGVLRLCTLCAKQVDTHTTGRMVTEQNSGVSIDLMEAEGGESGSEESGNEDDSAPLPSPRPSERSLNTSQYSTASRTGEEFPDANEDADWRRDLVGPMAEPRHQRAGSNQPEEDLHPPFKTCIRRTLDSLLRREQLCDERWTDFLLSLAYKLVEILYPMAMKRTEALSPLDFVHIKKLALSNIDIPAHEIIRGPAFTKSLHNSVMPSSAKNVSIMLLEGNVSYERVAEKFSPVETVLLQEREYLKIQDALQSLVERVTSRRVTLLLVENSVATSAADMLLDEGVSLVTDVRRKVLERIARCVGADIVTSLHGAQFLQPRVGFAPDFRQREFALVGGDRKFILSLDNCTGDGGVSVLLKGASRREVTAAKRLLRFLITAIFSSRLEISFLALFNSIPPVCNEEGGGKECPSASDCEVCTLNVGAQDTSSLSPSPFVEALRQVQLSNSPAILFAPPFLESESGHSCYLVPYFKSNLFPLFHAQDFQRCAELSDEKHTKRTDILNKYGEARHENSRLRHAMLSDTPMDVKALTSVSNWAAYRSRSALLFRRRYEKNSAARGEKMNAVIALDGEYQRSLGESEPSNPLTSTTDVLNPYNRQRIAFLYCANLRKPTTATARSFCIGPYVLQRQFFSSRSKDTSLGAFLVGYCFNADYKCKGCDRSMVEHLRRIVHRHVRIEITTSVLLKSGAVGEDFSTSDKLPSAIPNTSWASIICWRRCAICLSNSSITSMPDSVYHLSFAKFIDYLGNGTHWTSAIPSIQDATGKCSHCTFHQHWHYFALRNSVTRFKVHPIRPLHVILSPMCCRIITKELVCKELLEMKYDLETLADDIFEKAIAHVNDHHSGSEESTEELRSFVDQYRSTFQSHLRKFDPDGVFKTSSSVRSSDFYYIQSSSCLTRCRCFLHSFITKWNAKPTNAIHHVKSSIFSRRDPSSGNLLLPNLLSTASSTAALLLSHTSREESSQHLGGLAATDGESKTKEQIATETLAATGRPVSPGTAESQRGADLPLLPNPLPRDVHYDLPMNPSTILVRDLLDAKGNALGPDIGSVVAYTLACSEYEEKKHSVAATNGVKIANGTTNEQQPQQGEQEQSCEISFADARAHYCIRVYFPECFERIRGITFGDGEEQFIRSVSRTTPWNPQGGKSGAVFYRTEDERFIVKQMSRLELESFKKCGLKYLEYVNLAASERKLSALCKIYGVYSVHYASKVSGGSSMKIDVLVMEYLFYGKNVKQLWDLKGSLRNRYATTKTPETPVLLDENLAQDLWRNQLYIHPHSKAALNKAIVNDSHFLCSQGIMDYSLLAGICHENDEVVIGIVDYMRTYTLDKKVESLVKTALPIAHSPTVVSPELYCKRFYDAIDNYFAMSPDQWTSSDPFFD